MVKVSRNQPKSRPGKKFAAGTVKNSNAKSSSFKKSNHKKNLGMGLHLLNEFYICLQLILNKSRLQLSQLKSMFYHKERIAGFVCNNYKYSRPLLHIFKY